jgi:hypothetical protein
MIPAHLGQAPLEEAGIPSYLADEKSVGMVLMLYWVTGWTIRF